MRRFLFGSLLLVAALCHAQQSDDDAGVLRVESRLVNVFVNVTDQHGALVGGLGREDFAITEDGRAQKIAVFERQSALPLSMVLAIDTSGSTFKDRAAEADAARRFAHSILREQDRMSLFQFATDVRELVPFTNKLAEIDRGLGRLKGDFATALYDAVYLASDRLSGREGRRVLILISDGEDTAKSTTYQQAVHQALKGEVMIYSLIDVPVAASAGRDLAGEHALIALSEQTGGKSYYVAEGGLDKAFARIGDDLRTQYLLGYYPEHQRPGNAFHRIEVRVPRADAEQFVVRHRTGYYAPTAKKDE